MLLAPVAIGGNDEHPRLRRRAREPAQELQRLAVGPVQVVGDEQQRPDATEPAAAAPPPRSAGRSGRSSGSPAAVAGAPVRRASSGTSRAAASGAAPRHVRERVGLADAQQELEPLAQRLVRRADGRVRGAVEDEHARGRRPRGRARARAASCRRRPRPRAAPARPRRPRRARAASAASPSSSAATDERKRRLGHERARQRDAARRASRRARRARAPRPGSGSASRAAAAPRSARARARRAPRARRGRPSSASACRPDAVEREHQLRAQPLTMRVLGDQRLELADEVGVAAEREVGLDPLLERREPQVLQPPRLDAARTAPAELGQRRPAPEASASRSRLRRLGRIRRRVRPRPAARTAAGRPPPARPRAGTRAAASTSTPGRQQLPQPRHVDLHRRDRRLRRLLAPELVDQPLARDDAVRVQQRAARAGRAASRPERDRLAADANLQRPQQPELELISRRQLLSHVHRPSSIAPAEPVRSPGRRPFFRPTLYRITSRCLYRPALTSTRPALRLAAYSQARSLRRRFMTTDPKTRRSTGTRHVRRGLIVAACVWCTATTVAHMLRAGRREPVGARP